MACVSLSFYLQRPQRFQLEEGEYWGVYEVIEQSKESIVLKGNGTILVYQPSAQLRVGDQIEACIKVTKFKEKSYEMDFDTKAFYAAKRIYNRGSILSYHRIGHKLNRNSIIYEILNFYKRRLGETTYSYVETLLFGRSTLDTTIKQAYSSLYLSHILAISGLHILFFYQVFITLFRKIFRIEGTVFSIFLLGAYVFLIGYPPSAFRAFLFLFLGFLKERRGLRFTKLDILSISYIIMVLINPISAYQSGFIMSYLVCFLLIFIKEFIKWKHPLGRAFLQNILCIFSILPFIINQTNQISILGIFLSFFLGLFFGRYVLLFMLMILIIPLQQYESIFVSLNQFLVGLSNVSYCIKIPSLNIYWILCYYILFCFFLIGLAKHQNLGFRFIPILAYLIFLSMIRMVNPYYKVTFIDVGQGDSILIELPFNQGNILIDSYYGTTNYLNRIGITKIDYLVITHFDQDHMGELDKLLKNFRITKLLYSKYEDLEPIKNMEKVDRIGVGALDSFTCGAVRFSILGPINLSKDSNSNSIVLSFKLKEYSFLLTGDMTIKEENDLIEYFKDDLKADVLKVAHHGSKSSSSIEFLNLVKPSLSILSVGENNRYGLPDTTVVQRLKQYSTILMTKDHGNIQLLIYNTLNVSPYR